MLKVLTPLLFSSSLYYMVAFMKLYSGWNCLKRTAPDLPNTKRSTLIAKGVRKGKLKLHCLSLHIHSRER